MDNPANSTDARLTAYFSDPALQATLDAAWRALQREPSLAGLVARIQAGQLDSADAADAVVNATRRALRNPEGHESADAAIDDYRESWKRADSTEDIYFTAAELRRLAGPTFTAGSFPYSGYGQC